MLAHCGQYVTLATANENTVGCEEHTLCTVAETRLYALTKQVLPHL